MSTRFLIADKLAGRFELTAEGVFTGIERIDLQLEGRLESFRSELLNSRNAIAAGRKVKATQAVWMLKLASLGAIKCIERLQRECALAGVCIEVSATAKRRVMIRDHKDIEAAVDHQVLDALVKMGALVNDDAGNLVTGPMICEPTEKYLCGGRECLLLSFRRTDRPCRDSVTQRVLKNGWPETKPVRHRGTL